jgi:hypothetical protein
LAAPIGIPSVPSMLEKNNQSLSNLPKYQRNSFKTVIIIIFPVPVKSRLDFTC